ncbi:retrovirus-related pol polyprotein from transposon TNT 1-94, partial [Tanacetum coccineum]
KGKEIVDIVAQIPSANTIVPGMFKLDLEPLAPRLLQNREAHLEYLKYTQEQADILQEIVEQAKAKQPLDSALDFACKHAQRIQELLVYIRDTCPNANKLSAKKVAVTPKNNVKKVRIEVFTSANVVPHKKTNSHSVETQKSELKVYSKKPKNVKNVGSSKKAKIVESKNANHSKPNHTWGSNATDIPSSSSLVMTGCPDCSLVSGLRMFQTHDRESLLAHELYHLCSACAFGKSKKSSHQPKAEDTNQEKLYLLHMDLCGPMRVASINEKRYILVIVDDYSRFTWVGFLRTKDEAPEAIIKCIKNIQVRLNATVRNVQTDNGTEFVNQTLREFYENVGISHQTSVARTP